MIRIKNCLAVSCFVFCLCLIIPSLCFAENLPEKNPIDNTDSNNAVSTPKKQGNPQAGNISDKSTANTIAPSKQTNKERETEEEQDLMEKALDLLEVADTFWKKGDVENTLNTLDKAYALILDTNGDPAVARQKDDLRLLISKRILTAYSAKQTVANGKASEIQLIMNRDVEKEIRSFQGIERDFFISSYQRSGMYRPIIIKALKKAGIPEELSWLPLVESGFKILALSRARALGLWQFIPSTGYKFGLSRDEWIDERMDVEKSTEAAIAYLKELHGMFGDWLTVLAAYNCGEGRVLRVISRQHINYFDRFWDLYNQLPNETARYVPRFLATLHIIKDPRKYGMDLGNTIEKPIAYDFVKVNKAMKLHDIASKIEVPEETLNLLNSELRYKITPDKEYDLKIPVDSISTFNLIVGEIPESEKPRFAVSGMVFAKHRVKKGETISSIAKRYRISTSTIISYNNINKKNGLIFAGQKLRIPIIRTTRIEKNKSRSLTNKVRKTLIVNQTLSAADMDKMGTNKYIVTKGDNLSIIAKKNNSSSAKLMQLNNLSGDETLNPGQILIIK